MKKLLGITIVVLLSCDVLFAVDPPTSFTATPILASMDLDWTKNTAGNDVMITTNSISTAGPPIHNATYNVGDTLPNAGGLVIYKGSDLTFVDSGLLAKSFYYYQAWSVQNNKHYSTAVLAEAATTPEPGMMIGLVLAGVAMVRRRG